MAHAEGSAAVVAGACGDDDETGQQQQQQQKEPGHPPVKRVRFDQGYELPSNQDKAECRQFDTTGASCMSSLHGVHTCVSEWMPRMPLSALCHPPRWNKIRVRWPR